MNILKKLIGTIIILFFTFSWLPITIYGAKSEIGYSVRAILPENQIDLSKSYFDLRMKPGQKQNLKVKIFNSGSTEATIETEITFASTNRNGIIDYSKTDRNSADISLKYPLIEIAKVNNKEVTIPSGGTRLVTITIEMPNQAFEGVILGAIHFTKKVAKEDRKNTSSGIVIKNQYAYVVGIQLRENLKEVKPDLHLKYIKPMLVNYKTAIVANIQNNEPSIVENMSVNANVYKKESNKVLYSSDKKGLSMAPNSNFDYTIDLNNNPLKPGTYRLKMKAISGEQIWEWDEEFIIGKNVKKLNNKALDMKRNYSSWYISGGVFLFLIFIYILYRRKKKSVNE